jgi:membrane-bound inhibitor of C-type lysozyme
VGRAGGETLRVAASSVVFFLSAATAWATADGPDYFRVVDTHGYPLNIRAAANAEAKIVGAIPGDGSGIKNLGCTGGLAASEYISASPDRRREAKFTRWCRVDYKGAVGWAAGWYLAEAPAPVKPTFECSGASGAAARLVCRDSGIAALDRELAGLGAKAGAGNCGGSGDALGVCVIADYAKRIHDARVSLPAEARGKVQGLSLGPFVYDCEGTQDKLTVVFLRGALPMVTLHWGAERRVLAQVASGSGARYAAEAGALEFWIKGAKARFTRPGISAADCQTEPVSQP